MSKVSVPSAAAAPGASGVGAPPAEGRLTVPSEGRGLGPSSGSADSPGAGPRVVIWRHTDREINRAIESAIRVQTPLDADPRVPFQKMSRAERVRYMRSLSIATLYVMEDARRGGVRLPGEMENDLKLGMVPFEGRDFPTEGALYAASWLGRGPLLFGDPGQHHVYSADTHGGDPAVIDKAGPSGVVGDVGALPALAVTVVLIAGVAALGLALCYCGQAAAEVWDRKLTEDGLTARMAQTQAAAADVVAAHNAKEKAAGHPLPYDEGELRLLDLHRATVESLARRDRVPLPNPFLGAVTSMGEAAKHAGKAAEKAASKAAEGLEIGTAIVVVVAGLALFAATRRADTTTGALSDEG